MPMYEYRCLDCEQEFTEMNTYTRRDEPQECPDCGSTNSERLLSTPSLLGGYNSYSSGSSCGGGGRFT
ncbi:MAG: zinc ribbon domain-containing protein [bacterium]|nr:zinc ribbon domain-containing protein [bacterium]